MKLLLDTHILLWWDSAPERLSPVARQGLNDVGNLLLLSVAGVWEMQIKVQSGKLRLQLPLMQLINDQQNTNGLQILPISLDHVLALDALPLHHRDPFDRMLMAQANAEGATLVSADPVFQKYPVTLLW